MAVLSAVREGKAAGFEKRQAAPCITSAMRASIIGVVPAGGEVRPSDLIDVELQPLPYHPFNGVGTLRNARAGDESAQTQVRPLATPFMTTRLWSLSLEEVQQSRRRRRMG